MINKRGLFAETAAPDEPDLDVVAGKTMAQLVSKGLSPSNSVKSAGKSAGSGIVTMIPVSSPKKLSLERQQVLVENMVNVLKIGTMKQSQHDLGKAVGAPATTGGKTKDILSDPDTLKAQRIKRTKLIKSDMRAQKRAAIGSTQIAEFLQAEHESVSRAYTDFLDAKGAFNRGVIEQAIINPKLVCHGLQLSPAPVPPSFLPTHETLKEGFSAPAAMFSSIHELRPNQIVRYIKRNPVMPATAPEQGKSIYDPNSMGPEIGLARVSHKRLGPFNLSPAEPTSHLSPFLGSFQFISKFLKEPLITAKDVLQEAKLMVGMKDGAFEKRVEQASGSQSGPPDPLGLQRDILREGYKPKKPSGKGLQIQDDRQSQDELVYIYPLRDNNCLSMRQDPDLDRIKVPLKDLRVYNGYCGLPKQLCTDPEMDATKALPAVSAACNDAVKNILTSNCSKLPIGLNAEEYRGQEQRIKGYAQRYKSSLLQLQRSEQQIARTYLGAQEKRRYEGSYIKKRKTELESISAEQQSQAAVLENLVVPRLGSGDRLPSANEMDI